MGCSCSVTSAHGRSGSNKDSRTIQCSHEMTQTLKNASLRCDIRTDVGTLKLKHKSEESVSSYSKVNEHHLHVNHVNPDDKTSPVRSVEAIHSDISSSESPTNIDLVSQGTVKPQVGLDVTESTETVERADRDDIEKPILIKLDSDASQVDADTISNEASRPDAETLDTECLEATDAKSDNDNTDMDDNPRAQEPRATISTDVNMSSSWADVAAKYRDVSSKCARYVDLLQSTPPPTPDIITGQEHQHLATLDHVDSSLNKNTALETVTIPESNYDSWQISGKSNATMSDTVKSLSIFDKNVDDKSRDVQSLAMNMMLDAIAGACNEISTESLQKINDSCNTTDKASPDLTENKSDKGRLHMINSQEVIGTAAAHASPVTVDVGKDDDRCDKPTEVEREQLTDLSPHNDKCNHSNEVIIGDGNLTEGKHVTMAERHKGGEINHSLDHIADITTNTQESAQNNIHRQIPSETDSENDQNTLKGCKHNNALNKGDRVTMAKKLSKHQRTKSNHSPRDSIQGNNSNNAKITPSKSEAEAAETTASNNGSAENAKRANLPKSKKSLTVSATGSTSNNHEVIQQETLSRSYRKRVRRVREKCIQASMSPLSKSIAIYSTDKDVDAVTTHKRHSRSSRTDTSSSDRTKDTKSKRKDSVRYQGATSVSPAQMQLLDHSVNRFSTTAAVPLFPDGSRLSTKSETEI